MKQKTKPLVRLIRRSDQTEVVYLDRGDGKAVGAPLAIRWANEVLWRTFDPDGGWVYSERDSPRYEESVFQGSLQTWLQ